MINKQWFNCSNPDNWHVYGKTKTTSEARWDTAGIELCEGFDLTFAAKLACWLIATIVIVLYLAPHGRLASP